MSKPVRLADIGVFYGTGYFQSCGDIDKHINKLIYRTPEHLRDTEFGSGGNTEIEWLEWAENEVKILESERLIT